MMSLMLMATQAVYSVSVDSPFSSHCCQAQSTDHPWWTAESTTLHRWICRPTVWSWSVLWKKTMCARRFYDASRDCDVGECLSCASNVYLWTTFQHHPHVLPLRAPEYWTTICDCFRPLPDYVLKPSSDHHRCSYPPSTYPSPGPRPLLLWVWISSA